MTRIILNRIKRSVLYLWAGVALLIFGNVLNGDTSAAELLFYSSVPRNLSEGLVRAFEAQNPDITVKIFQTGTETLLEKVELEIKGKGRPEADVLWIQDKGSDGAFGRAWSLSAIFAEWL
jgi:ABC-type glycerol-3-phosphate transport system substrate-binding protein